MDSGHVCVESGIQNNNNKDKTIFVFISREDCMCFVCLFVCFCFLPICLWIRGREILKGRECLYWQVLGNSIIGYRRRGHYPSLIFNHSLAC